MRPVNKGTAPKTYSNYKNARNDLASQIGWYCSYCEMPVKNMIEVEHIVPVNQGGFELEWENFLLSCRYCNGIKSDNNTSRNGFFWPDINNPLLFLLYTPFNSVEVTTTQLSPDNLQIARATIQLTGIDRHLSSLNQPTEADSRWRHRDDAWMIAARSYDNWIKVPTDEMLVQVILTAQGTGFFSVWIIIFENELRIKDALINAFPGTALDCFDEDYNPIVRETI